MKKRIQIDIAAVRNQTAYDPKTGVLMWKPDSGHSRSGFEVGYLNPSGYRLAKFGGQMHKVVRLVWAHHYGEQPPFMIDHINGVTSDDRIENLRAADYRSNGINRKVAVNSSTGVTGVYRTGDRWRAEIMVAKKKRHLGIFANKWRAIAARHAAEVESFGAFAPSLSR